MSGRPGAALAACILAVAAGCGGSGGSGGGDSWAERADAICAETEAKIRERVPAKSSADLERLMAAVVDDLKAGRSELEQLELPEDRRKKAEPFLRDVDRVIATAEKVRDSATDGAKVAQMETDARVLNIDLMDHGRAVGVRRCGGKVAEAAVDAFLTPGYATAVAESMSVVLPALELAGRVGKRDGTREQRFAYWRQIVRVADVISVDLDAPESLRDEEGGYLDPLGGQISVLEDILGHTAGGRYDSLSERRFRAYVRKADKAIAATRRGGYALLKATGAPGEALIPRVRAAVEKGP